MRNRRTNVILALMLLAAIGCREDGIRSYQVPKEKQEKAAQVPKEKQEKAAAEKPKLSLLAVIVPCKDRVWFFKLVGPAAAIEREVDAFNGFLRSVRFPEEGAEPVTWTVPEGWRREPGNEMRYATLVLGTKDQPLELTVIPLGREAGSLLDNVNRWREQMGLGKLAESALSEITKPIKVDGLAATLVVMRSPDDATPKEPPERGKKTNATPLPFQYRAPEGWKEAALVPFAVLTFRVSEGDQSSEISVSPLGGPAGGLSTNVNRWRQQLELAPASEDELKKLVVELDLPGGRASYVDFASSGAGDAPKKRILGIVLPRSGTTWFIKMRGPADLVAKQKTAFEEFARSMKFE